MDSLIALITFLLCANGCLSKPYHRPAGYYAPAPVGHDGRVIDTPEVAQAKAAHLAAFSNTASRSLNPYYNSPNPYVPGAVAPAAYQPQRGYSNPGFYSARIQHAPYGYEGPPAPLAHDGRVIDTPEVAQAKAAHFAAYSQAASRGNNVAAAAGPAISHNANDDYNDYGPYNNNDNSEDDNGSTSDEAQYEAHASSQYQGPPAPLAKNGQVIDTPEVAQAKAIHLAAHQRAHQIAPRFAHNAYYGDC